MTEICRKKYANSPLLEIVCEINFLGFQDNSTIPGYFHQKIESEFPNIQEGVRYVLENADSENADSETTDSPALTEKKSTRFYNQEETKFVQISDGVLIINLNGSEYHSYEKFSEIILNIFASYLEVGKPEKIERLRLRYINLVSMPYPADKGINLAEYFNYYPIAGEESYNFRLQLNTPAHHDGHTIFIEMSSMVDTLLEDKAPEIANIVLDINNLTVGGDNTASIDSITTILKEAHENVGRTFEKLLTDKTRNLFKEVEDETCVW